MRNIGKAWTKGGAMERGGHSPSKWGQMVESRVNIRVQELEPAITPVMRIGYLKWLSWLCDRVLEKIHCSIKVII
jgi:hypothetical protein